MLTQATQHVIAIVRDTSSTEDAMQAAAQAVLRAADRAPKAEANAALTQLAAHVSIDDLPRAAFLAMLCGALVESGCDAAPLVQPLSQRLQALLESSARLADATLAKMPKPRNRDAAPMEAFESTRQHVAGAMPAENAAWEALLTFWRPAIAVFSVSRSARAQARGMRALAAKIADQHEGGHWLRLILSVLDDEPVVAIEPQARQGMQARMSGVVDNFQLNVLLMDAFPRSFFSFRRVSRRIADVARGNGPQQTDDIVTSVWNLYTWKAIQPDLTLPNPSDQGASKCWIWNEGSPEDIPVFEGHRVILLGPPSYPRSWGSQRMFNKLPAALEIERQLTKTEAIDWLQRMAAASKNA